MKIALLGNPNSGKTTIFNALTGSSQYVGNWPGVTVEKKEGKLKKHKDVRIIDLPGVYSLSPYSVEEIITRDYIIEEKPDLIINIVDASNLERNLYLTTQAIETDVPMIIALNMMDVLNRSGDSIDASKLSKRIGVPVVETSARYNLGIEELIAQSIKTADKKQLPNSTVCYLKELESLIEKVRNRGYERYHAINIIEGDPEILKDPNVSRIYDDIKKDIESIENKYDDSLESMITSTRYDYVAEILRGIYQKKSGLDHLTLSDKIDRVITNKFLGLPIFFAIMWFIYFISITTVGDMTIQLVETFFGFLQESIFMALDTIGVNEIIISLVVDGVLGSLGAIFVFVPQLMILFVFLSILEDSGYMARVAFIMDRLFRRFGLSGKSFIPMLVGTGCSIPGIMATRTIEREKDRKMTILLTPFVPCGAKLPVFAMFIAMMFHNQPWVGPSIYLISLVVIVISGLILKQTKMFKGDPAPFILELPKYSIPTLRGVLTHMWERAKSFVLKAGTIIFVSNVIIWTLMSFSWSFEYVAEDISQSMLASIGKVVRYIFIPLGFGDSWKAPVATLTGLIAKEVVVSTFATIGSVSEIIFTQVSAFSFMIFTVFAAPCFAAIGAMKREFASKKITFFAVAFQTGLAYILAMIVNIFGSIIFKDTAATQPVVLDYNIMEQSSESSSVIIGDITLYIFVFFILLAIGIGLYSKFGSRKTAKS